MPGEQPTQRGALARGPERISSLDGLRGLAALVVMLHHSLLASQPALAGVYQLGPAPAPGALGRLFAYTPLHIFWAGQEFVVVFFVLSGFVLALPTARGGRLPRIAAYYGSRFVRLYLPVWGALAFAAYLHLVVDHAALPGASWWLNAHSQSLALGAAAQDAGLLSKHTGHWALLDVLWSLRWEVVFSLALPVLLLACLALRARVRSWSALAGVLCFAALARHGSNEYLLELPPFVLGTLLAFQFERIQRLAAALGRPAAGGAGAGRAAATGAEPGRAAATDAGAGRAAATGAGPGRGRRARNTAVKLALGAACVGALTADWWIPGAGTEPDLAGLVAIVVAAGACLILVAALAVDAFGAFLRTPVMHWVGRRSYSLYLVHAPIVVALALLAGGRPPLVPYLFAAAALSLAGAAIFFRLVESPAHGLARRLGAHAAAAAERRALFSGRGRTGRDEVRRHLRGRRAAHQARRAAHR